MWLLSTAIAMVVLGGATLLILWKRRLTPDERERRRRLAINRKRRTIEGFITEATSEIIHYQYALRSVEYFASQDVSSLTQFLPAEPSRLIGPVSVRFDPQNPANSIILCEEWSGLPRGAGTLPN